MADFLIKAGADIELGCSTPLMEAAQEGHLELVKYLLAAGEEEMTSLAGFKNVLVKIQCLQAQSLVFIIQGQTFMPPRQLVTQH